MNLIYNSEILTFQNANYSIIGYQNIDIDSIHLLIINEINSMFICLIIQETTVNGAGFETLSELLDALGNPVELLLNTL
jgi:hypothetical protein